MRKKSPIRNLAKELGIYRTTAYRLIHKLWPNTKKGEDGQYLLTDDQLLLLRQRLQKVGGTTINQLADELNMDPPTVRNWCRVLCPTATKTVYGFILTQEQADAIRNAKKEKALRKQKRFRVKQRQAEEGSLWWRVERVASIGDVCKKIGMALQTLYTYRKRGKFPPVKRLIAIADYLNVSVDYLVGHQVKSL